ncbi:uncharacterized protein LOC129303263 [Prosopis cineraria]|uniref:uncharacterized protein LOC129303263 n=1 Tax=Prosopis cineraria TaxID=364024 RepID=UPI00241082F7|nr:uncharacterized protein LOC129303263 [Prosopis cineraria]
MAREASFEDAARFRKRLEKERLYESLVGLNLDLDDFRGRIQSLEPLPSVREAFAMIWREYSRRKVMLKDEPISRTSTFESFALVAKSNDPKSTKGRPTCEHCKKVGHTKDKCWDLHGKPPNWKPRKGKSRGYVAESSMGDDNSQPSNDQLSKIIEMLSALQTNRQPIATVVQRGSTDRDDDW